MTITLTKKAGKPHVLRCHRDDGTETWFQASHTNADFFATHDLSHYAIETVLGYTTAFYGMVATGRDLNDFGSEDGVFDQRGYSAEALWAENMANLMLLHVSYEEFGELLRLTYEAKVESAPPVSAIQYETVQTTLCQLLGQWRHLGVDESLTLEF